MARGRTNNPRGINQYTKGGGRSKRRSSKPRISLGELGKSYAEGRKLARKGGTVGVARAQVKAYAKVSPQPEVVKAHGGAFIRGTRSARRR